MIRYLLALLLAVTTATASAQPPARPFEACVADFLPFGAPTVKKQRTVKLCRDGYVLEYDPAAKVAIWAAYVLTPAKAVGCWPRTPTFARDPDLKRGDTSRLDDFTNSGFDKSHLVNNSDMRWSQVAELQSNLLTNMTPQKPRFNRGIWKKLEDSTRGWALSNDHSLLIYVGSIYSKDQDPTIGRSIVTVPHAFYKVIIDLVTNDVQVFLFQHEQSSAPLSSFITSLAEVQRQGLLTLPMPPGALYATKAWPIKVKSALGAKQHACAIN